MPLDIGIVDYGHRATPDVYLNAALSSGGKWNSSQYASKEFDQAFKDFQAAIGVEEQKTAGRKISDILQKDTPVIVPYFYQYLAAPTRRSTATSPPPLWARSTCRRAGLVV